MLNAIKSLPSYFGLRSTPTAADDLSSTMAPSSARKKIPSPNLSPTPQNLAVNTHVTSPPNPPPTGPLPAIPMTVRAVATDDEDDDQDDDDQDVKPMTGEDLKQMRSDLQKSNLLTFAQRKELETMILRGYLEGRGGGGSKMGSNVGRDSEEGDEQFLEHVRRIRVVMEGERDWRANKVKVGKLYQQAKDLVPTAETEGTLRELHERFRNDEKTSARAVELMNRSLSCTFFQMKDRAEVEAKMERELGPGGGMAMRAAVTEQLRRDKEQGMLRRQHGREGDSENVDFGGIDADIAAKAASENVDWIKQGIKEQQEIGIELMEKEIIPQKASRRNLERFCGMVQIPRIFENLSKVIPILALDQSHVIHPNPMITEILKATYHLRPVVPPIQKRPNAEPTSEPSSPIHKRSKAQPLHPVSPAPATASTKEKHLEDLFAAIGIPFDKEIFQPYLDPNKPVLTQSDFERIEASMAKRFAEAARSSSSAKSQSSTEWISKRLTQVEDLSDLDVKKPFPNAEAEISLFHGLIAVWVEHGRGKQNRKPISKGGTGDFWLHEPDEIGGTLKRSERPLKDSVQVRTRSDVTSESSTPAQNIFERKQQWLAGEQDESCLRFEEACNRSARVFDQEKSKRCKAHGNDWYDMNPDKRRGYPKMLTDEQKQYMATTMATFSEEVMEKAIRLVRRWIPDIPDKGHGKGDKIELDLDELSNDLVVSLSLFVWNYDPKEDSKLPWKRIGDCQGPC